MVSVIKNGNLAATGELASKLHCILDRFGTRVEQCAALLEVAGGVLVQQFADLDVWNIRSDGKECVGQLGYLLLNRRDQLVIGVANCGHADTRT